MAEGQRIDLRHGRAQQLTSDPANPFLAIQTGKVGIQGGEIEALVTIAGNTDVIAAYACTDARVLPGDTVGASVESMPLHLVSVWVKHRFSLFGIPGLRVGGSVC
ncbi:hypothetical protein [Methylobacterium marchantiae]|uniref:Uncharacterized protein n=1 Tax=Methylobacterium marchantiae TaxID=600331 RepID=A0ABW3WUJ1_9HYPH|nr:Ferrichrome outer membrane transporter/phage receptor [Methylobacterium marchantiae]